MSENDTTDGSDVQHTNNTDFSTDVGFNARNDSAMVSAKIHGDTFEVPMRHVAAVADRGRMQFDPNGVYTKVIDEDSVCMVRSYIPATEFRRYVVGSAGVEGVQFDRVTAQLRKMKTRLRTRDSIDINIRTDDTGDKFVSLSDIKARTVDIPLLSADSVGGDVSLPDLDLSADLDINDANKLREFLNGLPRRGAITLTASSKSRQDRTNATLTVEHFVAPDHVDDPSHSDREVQDTLVLTGDDVAVRPWGDDAATDAFDGSKLHGEAATDAHRGNTAHVTSTYTTSYFKQWCDDLRKTRTEGVRYRLRFRREFPLKLSRQDDTGITTEFMLAPRIINL